MAGDASVPDDRRLVSRETCQALSVPGGSGRSWRTKDEADIAIAIAIHNRNARYRPRWLWKKKLDVQRSKLLWRLPLLNSIAWKNYQKQILGR